MKSISSSGKSKQASTYKRKLTSSPNNAFTASENSPDKERTALLAASTVAALITSATASACAKSNLSLRYAAALAKKGSANR